MKVTKRALTTKERKALEAKLMTALGDNIQSLSTPMKKILTSDLVTAFENRLDVLSRTQETIHFEVQTSANLQLQKA